MRDYALNYAQAREATGAASWTSRLIRNWMARRAIARLEHYDDYMLSDIGVTRGDLHWAASLPLSENAALALEDRVLRRRHAVPAKG